MIRGRSEALWPGGRRRAHVPLPMARAGSPPRTEARTATSSWSCAATCESREGNAWSVRPPEARCWGPRQAYKLHRRRSAGCVGAAGAFRWSGEADGPLASGRVEGPLHQRCHQQLAHGAAHLLSRAAHVERAREGDEQRPRRARRRLVPRHPVRVGPVRHLGLTAACLLKMVGGGWRWLELVGAGWSWVVVVGGGWSWELLSLDSRSGEPRRPRQASQALSPPAAPPPARALYRPAVAQTSRSASGRIRVKMRVDGASVFDEAKT